MIKDRHLLRISAVNRSASRRMAASVWGGGGGVGPAATVDLRPRNPEICGDTPPCSPVTVRTPPVHVSARARQTPTRLTSKGVGPAHVIPGPALKIAGEWGRWAGGNDAGRTCSARSGQWRADTIWGGDAGRHVRG
ncbi:hypothetical protein NL676_010045 [Syzygium grande]|nr:hypothetical protein NL676_010045 [Syzygium grande]